MSVEDAKVAQLRSVFERVADERLTPDNFGKSLKGAVRVGLFSQEEVAEALGINDVSTICRVGDRLNSRQIRQVAQALVRRG